MNFNQKHSNLLPIVGPAANTYWNEAPVKGDVEVRKNEPTPQTKVPFGQKTQSSHADKYTSKLTPD
jgi:hypothetical protein